MSDTDRAPTPPADARVAEIRERAEKATPGPWHHGGWPRWAPAEDIIDGYTTINSHTRTQMRNGWHAFALVVSDNEDGTPNDEGRANASFIAHAREDVPFLLTEVDRLAARVAALEEALRRLLAASGGSRSTTRTVGGTRSG